MASPVPIFILSEAEAAIIEWIRLGAGLQAACQLSDVPLTAALQWLDAARTVPRSCHRRFAHEIKELGITVEPESDHRSKARHGGPRGYQHGNGSSSNGNGIKPSLSRWQDL
jgi:hypothetical protein